MIKPQISNDEIILNYIRRHGPVSKALIARQTKITPPTVTNICTSLIRKGLVYEDRQERSALGRPSMLLDFNHDIETYLIGGRIKKSTLAIVGVKALRDLSEFRFDKAFIGINGINENGYSTHDIEEALIKKKHRLLAAVLMKLCSICTEAYRISLNKSIR